ncbi:ATP-grasp domain-containing protein [Streptomyces sp. CA-251387]|uniref:ATP-grasp domain-containing protein n=1 Tax=Streptomyces sp. CA-251387 TaxID=3240064 RepID=UPI003D90A2D8
MNPTSKDRTEILVHGDPTPLRSVVLCKWQPVLARELMERALVHVVLDNFDVEHADIDQDLLSRASSVHVVSTFNALEELATVAVSIRLQDPEVGRVISFTEFSQLGGSYLAEVLGLGAQVPGSVATRDKRWMKHVLAEAGVPTPQFSSLPDHTDSAAVAAMAERLEFPVVVKPAAGFGTMSTHLAHNRAEFAETLRSFTYEPTLGSRQLIVESFVEAEELYVDAYWGNGGPHFYFVSRYFAPRLTVLRGGPQQDGGELLFREEHQELYEELESLTAQVMSALGISETMIHLEVFRRPDGKIVFSEIATRVGGGWSPGLMSQAMGRSVWTAIAELAITGRTERPRPVAPHIGVLHLRPHAPGRIVEIPTIEEIEATPGVLGAQVWHEKGDVLQMHHASEWVAFAFIGAETADELDRLFKLIPQRLPVRTAPIEALSR